MIKILKRVTIVALLFGCLQTITPQTKTKEKKKEDDNTALYTTLGVAGALGVGAGCYALWQHVTHRDSVADRISVNELSLCRWREVSLIPFKHAWWTEQEMSQDVKHVKRCLLKDLKQGLLVDCQGKIIENLDELETAFRNEIDTLQETKSVTIMASTFNKIKSWFSTPENTKAEKKQKKSVDRLLGRLKTLQKVSLELKKA